MKIFFSGIGGSGVSAIAGFMAEKGHIVSGSDRLFDSNPEHPVCRRLKSRGITISRQNGSGLDRSFDLAVFSTAVEGDNPDFIKARELAVAVKTRPEYLAEIVSGFRTVAVAGTSGKSTASGMLSYLMERLGMGPNFIGGGRVKQFRTEQNPGNYATGPSDILVVEACESDGTIVDYRPAYSLIMNLDLDHHSIRETGLMFGKLAENTSDLVIAGGDDRNLAQYDLGRARTFSIETASDYQAQDVEFSPFRTFFRVRGKAFELSLPGKHNLYNALACIALLSELGVGPEEIASLLPGFTGIERRFDVHLNNGRYLVVDDYAHNPHKISSLMQTMKRTGKKVCYIFQPHGYGPARLMRDGYIATFAENLRDPDLLLLLPIYYAGGTASKDISSRDIAEGVADRGKSAGAVEDRSEVFRDLGDHDCYVVFGARDDSLSDLAEEIAERLKGA